MCKSADMLLMVLDATKPWSHKEILTRELESVGMRLNRDPPNIYFKQKRTGRVVGGGAGECLEVVGLAEVWGERAGGVKVCSRGVYLAS